MTSLPFEVVFDECRNIGVPGGGAASGRANERAQQAAAAMARASGPSLAEVLKPEVIIPLLQVCRNQLECQPCSARPSD